MTTEIQARLLGAIYACMRPLARVLLRSGISYKHFADAAKSAFVHEAMLERDSRGRFTNTSRIAVRTGVSRKEVRRVIESTRGLETGTEIRVDHSGPPARVLSAWYSDPRFLDAAGTPLVLTFEHGTSSFTDLVRAVGGDVPPGAVRAELLRAGAIEQFEDGRLRPVKRYFVPGDFDEKAITILSGILFPLIASVDHNSNPHRQGGGFVQRFAFGRLRESNRAAFREWSREKSIRFIEAIDDWILAHEPEGAPDEPPETEPISGIGVYFYEGPVAGQLPVPPKVEETED